MATLGSYQPEISELTFTNFFIWRSHYRFQWSSYKDWLLVMGQEEEKGFFAVEPIGNSPRQEVTFMLLKWLKEQKGASPPRIERADKRLVAELEGAENILVEPSRDHFDYVYLRDELVELAGNKYRSKRNNINKLLRLYSVAYEPLSKEHVAECLELQEKWCNQRRCRADLNLMGEWEAIREILAHYESLDLRGGVILINGRVEAFTIGETLNPDTAVIHIEKANGDISGLYAIVNQQCCDKCWGDVKYINREQDLGMSSLREAKLSYYPDHFVEKFRVSLI